MSINKADLLAALLPKNQTIPVDGIGDLTIRQLTVGESDTMRAIADKDDKTSAFGLRLLGMSLIDDAGDRMFSDDEITDLKNSSGVEVDKLIEACLILNGYKKAADAKN